MPRSQWGTPILCVHGAIGSADTWNAEGVAASSGALGGRPRALAGYSRRGLGRSDAPPQGYGLDDFVTDLAAVAEELAYPRFVLLAHSLGVPSAIVYAARHPAGVAGLVLGDFGPRYPALSAQWLIRVEERHRRETEAGESSFRIEPMRAMQRESRATSLDDELTRITCPVRVVTGDRPDVLLTPDDRARYERGLADVRVVTIAGAGHDLEVDGRPDAFYAVLNDVLARVD